MAMFCTLCLPDNEMRFREERQAHARVTQLCGLPGGDVGCQGRRWAGRCGASRLSVIADIGLSAPDNPLTSHISGFYMPLPPLYDPSTPVRRLSSAAHRLVALLTIIAAPQRLENVAIRMEEGPEYPLRKSSFGFLGSAKWAPAELACAHHAPVGGLVYNCRRAQLSSRARYHFSPGEWGTSNRGPVK